MSSPTSRRSRPLTALGTKELCGMSVPHVRSVENSFRSEHFHREQRQFRALVHAIDAEQKQVERTLDASRSKFMREHLDLLKEGRKKVVYHKVGEVSEQPEERIPPCIPFMGTFPPARHPTKERRLHEMFKEPLFSRSTFHADDLDGSDLDDEEEDEGRSASRAGSGRDQQESANADHYAYILANHKVASSYGPVPAVSNAPRSPDVHALSRSAGRDEGKALGRGRSDEKGNRGKQAAKKNGRSKSVERIGSISGTQTPNRLKPPGRRSRGSRSPGKRTPDRSRRGSAGASGQASRSGSGSGSGSGSDSPSRRSDQTSESLNVELLQQALADHSTQNLARSRWHRATDRVRLPTQGDHDHHSDDGGGSSRTASTISVSTPTSRTATDVSESRNDTSLLVISLIMGLFRELDQPQLERLEDVWPEKMRRLWSEIERLVKATGVDVTDIVEKIQRGDVEDEKSAAFLDWIRNVDSTAVPQGDERRGSNSARRASAKSVSWDVLQQGSAVLDSSAGREWCPPSSVATGAQEVPAITILPPSRRQSREEEEKSRRRRSGDSGHSKAGKANSNGPKSSRKKSILGEQIEASAPLEFSTPSTSNEAALFYQFKQRASNLRRRSDNSDVDDQPDAAAESCPTQASAMIQSKPSDIEYPEAESSSPRLPEITSPRAWSSNVTNHAEVLGDGDLGDFRPRSKSSSQAADLKPSTRITRSVSENDKAETTKLPCVSPRQSLVAQGLETTEPPRSQSPRGTHHQATLSPQSPPARTTRRVSFSNVYRIDAASNHSAQGEPTYKKRDNPAGAMRRVSRTPSFSATSCGSESSDDQTQTFRGRVHSAGQKYPIRKVRTGSCKGQGRQGRSVSPSVGTSRRGREEAQGPALLNPGYLPGEDLSLDYLTDPRARLESTETVTHTDRLGKIHRLTMQRMSLYNDSVREANVIFTREDTLPAQVGEWYAADVGNERVAESRCEIVAVRAETAADPNNKEQQGTEPTNSCPRAMATNVDKGEVESNLGDNPLAERLAGEAQGHVVDQPGKTRNEITDAGKQAVGNRREAGRRADGTREAEKNRGEAEDDDKDAAAGGREPGKDRDDDSEKEEEEEEEAELWRRRLSRPQTMSWVPELSSDHRAQGLALSLLHRKEGSSSRFRSTALAVICNNALRAAKSVHDDDSYRQMRRCRYLRMPQNYMVETQKELSLQEIFS